MPRPPRRPRLVCLALAGLSMLAGCGGRSTRDGAAPPERAASEAAEAATDREAASIDAVGLRVALNTELREHTYLAASATGQALRGDAAGSAGAAAALDHNTTQLAQLVGTVYPDAQDSFRELWASHVDLLVRYTQAIAAGDQAAADGVAGELATFSQTLADRFEQITGLPADVSQPLVLQHVTGVKTVVDLQKAQDFDAAYRSLRTVIGHTDLMAMPLAATIARQQGLEGSARGQVPELQVSLNRLFQEHVFLAGSATDEALSGNIAGFAGAAAALGGNTNDLSNTVGSIYGQETGDLFNGLWSSHIDMLVRYTQGIGAGDQGAADTAAAELTEYVGTLASTLEQLSGLPADASGPAIGQHVRSLRGAVDAQKAGDPTSAFSQLAEAGQHMQMLADPLATRIARQQGLSQ